MANNKVWSSPAFIGDDESSQKTVVEETFSSFHQALLDVGLTETADLGQVSSLSSVTLPSSGGKFVYGYKIYALNDEIHTNSPIFIKIKYQTISHGSYPTALRLPCFAISVAAATNGLGSLVNPSSEVHTYPAASLPTSSGASALFKTGSFASYVSKQNGILWFMLKCNSFSRLSNNGYIIHPNYTGSGMPLACMAISRPCDEAGTILKNKVAVVAFSQININRDAFEYLSYSANCYFLNTETGVQFTSKRPMARPVSDHLVSINGAAPISRLYGYFGDGRLDQLSGIGSIGANQVADGDITSVAIEGVIKRRYIVPNRATNGFQDIPFAADDRNTPNSPAFDTPILAWGDEGAP